MRILLTGHGCAPETGSEPGVTWNWAISLAQENEVWVITHAYFRPMIERYLAKHPQSRLHFVYTDRLGWWDPLRLPSQRGIRFHYYMWRREVLRLARELDAKHDFDILHHVSWNTISAPPLLGKVGKPFVWGPVGGGQTTPLPFLRYFGKAIPVELVRMARIRMLPLVPEIRAVAAKADAVFAANRETLAVLRRCGAKAVPMMLDCGVPQGVLDMPAAERSKDGPFTVFWAGRIEPRKAVRLCLEVARLTGDANIRFLVAGEGPQAQAARRMAIELGVAEKVAFMGQQPWTEMQRLYRTAHLFLFTSIRDTSGNVAMEALAGGTPVVCLDHQGMGSHLPDAAAIKIPVRQPNIVAAQMAQAILDLAGDRERLARMALAGRRYAETEGWPARASSMQRQYQMILEKRSSAAPGRPGIAAVVEADSVSAAP